MKKYKELQKETPNNFKKLTGLSKKIEQLCDKVEVYINEEKNRNRLDIIYHPYPIM